MKMIRTLREWGSLVDPQYVMSQCGAQKMLIDGYSFVYHRVSGPRTFWRCDWCQKSKCRSTVATEAGQTYLKDVPHNHPRSKNLSVANRLYSHLKTAVCAFDNEPIPEIVKRVMEQNTSQQTNETMPSFDTLCRSMTRYRSRMRTFHRRSLQESVSSSQKTPTHQQQPLYHQIVSTSAYDASNVEEDLTRSLPQPSWNTTIEATIDNVLGLGAAAEQRNDMQFPQIVAADNVKEEMGDNSPVMEGLSLLTEVRSELFEQARQEAKRDEEAVTSETWAGGVDLQHRTLIKRVIEGYKQLCSVRKTAESSVSHASIMAMFSNGNEPESRQSQKMKTAKYAELQKYRQIEIPFLVDFVTKVFTEIGHLPSPSKVSLFREFVPYLWLAEMGYLSQNAFSADSDTGKLLVSMWQYIDEASLNNFFDEADENMQRVLKELLLDKQLECVVKPMNETGFTESEFAILLVWLLTESGGDSEMKETLANIRESTLCAADSYYQSASLGSCAVRMSSLVSIAFNIKILRERLQAAMTGVPFVNVFEAQAFL